MRYFRLFEDNPLRSPLGSGPGGGRWNHAGTHMIYLSNFSAIAINEILSIKGPIVTHSKWILATFEIKGKIPIIQESVLPKNWNARPAHQTTKDIGTIWANKMESVCLKVPSARLNLSAFPEEHNLLVNPLHPDFRKRVSHLKSEPFNFQITSIE